MLQRYYCKHGLNKRGGGGGAAKYSRLDLIVVCIFLVFVAVHFLNSASMFWGIHKKYIYIYR